MNKFFWQRYFRKAKIVLFDRRNLISGRFCVIKKWVIKIAVTYFLNFPLDVRVPTVLYLTQSWLLCKLIMQDILYFLKMSSSPVEKTDIGWRTHFEKIGYVLPHEFSKWSSLRQIYRTVDEHLIQHIDNAL